MIQPVAQPLTTLSGEYFRRGEFAVIPELISPELVACMNRDFEGARRSLVRKRLPGYKRSESLGWRTLRRSAPSIVALYRSPELLRFLSGLTDAPLMAAPDWDAHACAVYHYDRPGDGIGFHYDSSWYRGARFTVLIGLTNDSKSRLICELHTREKHRRPERTEVRTEPGTAVVFHGDKVWHAVSPIEAGERRTVLTLQYVTDPRMGLFGRAITFVKDALGYFGAREVLGSWVRPSDATPPLLSEGDAP